MKQYVVEKDYKWLRLTGSFKYPEWTDQRHAAESFTYAVAHQCAQAFGGTVKPV